MFWVNEKERAAAVGLRWCPGGQERCVWESCFLYTVAALAGGSTLVKLEGAGSSPELGKGKGKPHKGLGGH